MKSGTIKVVGPELGDPAWFRHWQNKTKEEIIHELARTVKRGMELEAKFKEATDLVREGHDLAEQAGKLLERARMFVFEDREFNCHVSVQWREPEKWAVADGGYVFDREGDWAIEPIPSERSEEFKALAYFDLDTAMMLAEKEFNEQVEHRKNCYIEVEDD